MSPSAERDHWGSAKWALAGCLVLAASLLTFFNSAYWLWVANSAFRGIRDEPDTGLGFQSVALTIAPLVGAFVTYRYRRELRSTRRGIARAASTGLVLQFVSTVYSVLLQGPF